MIKRIDITGIHMDIDENIEKYVTKRIGRLDRFIPKDNRNNLHAEVKLKEIKSKNKNERVCITILHVPQEIFTAEEATINIYAAVDIVEAKLAQQLRKYKTLHVRPRVHQRLLRKIYQR